MSPADRLIQTMQMMNQTLCRGRMGWFWLEPSGQPVDPRAARMAIESPLLKSNRDSLFDGLEQTWRYIGEEKA